MDIFSLLSLSSAKYLQKYSQYSIYLAKLQLSEMLWSLSFFLLSLFVSLRLFYISFVCVSFGLFAPLSVVFPSPITSSSYCVIGVCPCVPFSISTSLLHLCSFRPSLRLFSLLFLPLSVFLCVLILRGRRLICVLLSAVPLCRWLPAVNPQASFTLTPVYHPLITLSANHTHTLITIRYIRETVRQS